MPVEIIESFKHEPLYDFRGSVERLIQFLPPAYVASLGAVVLKNGSEAFAKRKRVRLGHGKVPGKTVGGLYFHSTRNSRAYIELFVDNIAPPPLEWALRYRFLRDGFVSAVLYHEIGHHLDAIGERSRNGEATAEEWRRKLQKAYARKHHPYLRPFKKIIIGVIVAVSLILWRFRRADVTPD